VNQAYHEGYCSNSSLLLRTFSASPAPAGHGRKLACSEQTRRPVSESKCPDSVLPAGWSLAPRHRVLLEKPQ
jgi:hypothetical protein